MRFVIESATENTGPWMEETSQEVASETEAQQFLREDLLRTAGPGYEAECLMRWDACIDKSTGVIMPNDLDWSENPQSFDRFRLIS